MWSTEEEVQEVSSGAFTTMHKQKREAVRQSEKTIVENVKIAEKKKELRAKKKPV